MAYADRTDLQKRYGADELLQLTHRTSVEVPVEALRGAIAGEAITGYTQEVQDAVAAILETIDEALQDALGEIEPRLQAGGYDLPLASSPRMLIKAHADIARYYLHGDAVTDVVRQRYEDAISWLKAVVRGQADLGLTAADEAAEDPTGGVQYEAADRVFPDDTLDQFASGT